MLERDSDRYSALLRAMAALSGLFSDNSAPYIDSRFVERLFVTTTDGIDIGRTDKSFDAVIGDIGVGVKTFLGGAGNSKREKVAEFTALARTGKFARLEGERLVRAVVAARNTRVVSDARELGLDINRCVYHCLIRFSGGAIVHEEPYRLISVENLQPTNQSGGVVDSWSQTGRGIYFTDGQSFYSYSTAKNVLFKRFEFDRGNGFIPLDIRSNAMDLLGSIFGDSSTAYVTDSLGDTEETDMRAGIDFVILPLYSISTGNVAPKSGINQWNAGGRKRKFGEAYLPIPSVIHHKYPDFFPARDSSFELFLPNSAKAQSGKVCQENSKALMTSPNNALGVWLVSVLDPSVPLTAFDEPPSRKRPFTYDDLLSVGKDSVLVRKKGQGADAQYHLSFAAVGSFEEFIAD